MKKDVLKKKIKAKFGTFTKFTGAVGIPHYKFQTEFLSKEFPDKSFMILIEEKYQVTDIDLKLSKETIKELRELIDNAGGVIEFCKNAVGENNVEMFNTVMVFNILRNKYPQEQKSGVIITPAVRRLLDYFSIEA